MDVLVLTFAAYLLGMRHGFDPDHLGAIDSMVRANSTQPRIARRVGLLFALGHGSVVTVIAIIFALTSSHWSVPVWLEAFGGTISALCLILLAGINLHAICRTDKAFVPRGLKTRLFGFASRMRHPVLIVAIGALFAASFDTVSQAALFSITATGRYGWIFAGGLGAIFMLGMMSSDSLNSAWCAYLLDRAGQSGDFASRIGGLIVCVLCLVIAGAGVTNISMSFGIGGADYSNLVAGMLIIMILSIGVPLAIAATSLHSKRRIGKIRTVRNTLEQ